MKITTIKEVVVDHGRVTVSINPISKETSMVLCYTCPDCAGHSCRSHGNTSGGNPDCSGGTVTVKIVPSKIDQQLDVETARNIKAVITDLYQELTRVTR